MLSAPDSRASRWRPPSVGHRADHGQELLERLGGEVALVTLVAGVEVVAVNNGVAGGVVYLELPGALVGAALGAVGRDGRGQGGASLVALDRGERARAGASRVAGRILERALPVAQVPGE